MTPIMADHPSATDYRARRSSVKARLTPNRRRRPVENDEYASFIRRVLRAYARRVATGDVDALTDMTGLATEMDKAISQAITGLRTTGYSWAEIAARLGVTRQAAQQRWGHSWGCTGGATLGATPPNDFPVLRTGMNSGQGRAEVTNRSERPRMPSRTSTDSECRGFRVLRTMRRSQVTRDHEIGAATQSDNNYSIYTSNLSG